MIASGFARPANEIGQEEYLRPALTRAEFPMFDAETRAERRMSATARFIDRVQTNIVPTLNSSTASAENMRIESGQRIMKAMWNSVAFQGMDILADIDFDAVGEHLAKQDIRFEAEWREWRSGIHRRVEHVADGMDRTQFPEFLKQCVEIATLMPCPTVRADSIVDRLGRMMVGCTQDRLASPPFMPEIPFGCEVPDEELKLMGLITPLFFEVAPRCESRIGFGFKENLRCLGLMEAVRAVVEEETRPKFTKQIAREAVKMWIGLPHTVGTCDKYAPVINGEKYKSFYEAGEGPWVNKLCQNTTLERCDAHALFCAIEALYDTSKNPVSGDLQNCCDSWESIVFGDGCMFEAWSEMLGPQMVQYGNCPTTGCGERSEIQRSARARWGTIYWHRYLKEFAVEAFMKACTGWTQAQAEDAANRTVLTGCIPQTFYLTVETDFTRKSHGGPNSWIWFNQKVEEIVSFEHKVGFFVNPLNLGGCVLVQGSPDGIACGGCV